jgi:WD40 repeat protein
MMTHDGKLAAVFAVTLGLGGLALAAAPRTIAPAPVPPHQAARADVYGDPLPDGALARLGTLRWRHAGNVFLVAYTKDGGQLFTGSQDGTVRLWEAETGRETRRFGTEVVPPNQTGGPVDAAAWMNYQNRVITAAAKSPDDELLATASQTGTLTLWDVGTGRQARQWKANPATGVFSLAFSPDRKLMVSIGYDQIVRLWDVAEAKEIRKFTVQANGPRRIFFRGGAAGSTAFAPDGATLYCAGMELNAGRYSNILKRWEVATGKELPSIKSPQSGFQSLAFAPDGKTIAWAANDAVIRLWDIATGKEIRAFGGPQQGGAPNAMTFSADGKTLATRSYDQVIRLWETATGKERGQIGGQQNAQGVPVVMYGGNSASNLAFAPGGRYIASGAGTNSVGQWDVGTRKPRSSSGGHHGPVFTLAVSPDGRSIITRASDNSVHVWDAALGKQTRQFTITGQVQQAAFSGDGAMLVVGGYDGTVRVWDVKDGKELHQLKPIQNQNRFGGMNGVVGLALSRDGKLLASRSGDQVIRLWETATGKEIRKIAEVAMADNGQMFFASGGYNQHSPPRLIFSPDGTTVAALPLEGTLIDLTTGRQTQLEQTIRLWDVSTGKVVRRFDPPKTKPLAFAFARDGRTVATANQGNTISLWEVASGKERFQFGTGSAGILNALAYAPDGRTLCGAGQGQTVGFWDALSGAELVQFKGHQGTVVSLTYAANGRTVVSGGWDTTALVWDMDRVDRMRKSGGAAEPDSQRIDALWADLASTDARKAFEAYRTLSAAPRQATTLLEERVKAVAPVDPQQLAGLMRDLDSNVFIVRHRATNQLEKLGDLAEPVLKETLTAGPGLDTRQRLERLLERLVTGQPPPPEELRTLRALEVLEQLDTAEARRVLQSLTKGATGARLTRQAKATLDRLGRQ